MGSLAPLMQAAREGKRVTVSIDGKDITGMLTSARADFDGFGAPSIDLTIVQDGPHFKHDTVTVDAMLKRPEFIRRNIDDLMGGARCRGTLVALYPPDREPHADDAPTWCPDCASRMERDAARQAYVCPERGCGYMLTDERIARGERR